jgi:hypothetical protein
MKNTTFYIKLMNKEYWPMWATYFPVIFYYLYLSFRARSFFFFSAANPGIETGGMLGESKKEILDKIDGVFKPTSLFIEKHQSFKIVLELMRQHKVHFPIVAKPNVGERGILVERLNNESELKVYLTKNDIDYIIQPFVDYEEELAIMFWRMPNEDTITINSITRKEFLSFIGDGKQTLREMIMAYPRAVLQLEKLENRFADIIDLVIPKGKKIELEPIGNHSRGTKFLDGNYLINKDLENIFSKIVLDLDGIYFGRFDLKCKSIEDLQKGKNIAILELNGVGAEPAHIYDPNSKLLEVWKTLLNQWSIMFRIAMYNQKVRNIPFMTFKETWVYWQNLKKYHAALKE